MMKLAKIAALMALPAYKDVTLMAIDYDSAKPTWGGGSPAGAAAWSHLQTSR